MRVLLLGSGGRESAMAAALQRSAAVAELIAAPGNPGIARAAEVSPIDATDPAAVCSLAERLRPQLVVVGPEAPLVAGVSDALRAKGHPVFGPDKEAARIEGSKSFAKELMERSGIATARGQTFREVAPAVAHLDALGPPYVVKADGLAAGKGVLVTEDRAEAVRGVEERLLGGRFGDAGRTVVIEEFLDGEELSVIAFSDGRTVVPCPPAQDYKRALDGDEGENTGGMGSYSPVPSCPEQLAAAITGDVIEPMVAALAARGTPFVGAIYAGLAVSERGPRVIEFNARFGDPETQALLPRLESDFAELCLASATGQLEGTKLHCRPDACVAVVVASRGYPGPYETGMVIDGIEEAESVAGVEVFHSGTRLIAGELRTDGGRVLAVSALGEDFAIARARAYEAVSNIHFEGARRRADIALRAERREQERR
ncbi:MAG: phosphoribosylamine--glycine ligase [Actinomycetota bacterium]|nr:phosphoribosylamine--glycine ligase [Actinomycetota bacterium]